MGVGVREDLEGPEKSFSFWNKEIWLRNEDNLEAKPQRKMVQGTTKSYLMFCLSQHHKADLEIAGIYYLLSDLTKCKRRLI